MDNSRLVVLAELIGHFIADDRDAERNEAERAGVGDEGSQTTDDGVRLPKS